MVAKERLGVLALAIYHSNQVVYLDVSTLCFVFTQKSLTNIQYIKPSVFIQIFNFG